MPAMIKRRSAASMDSTKLFHIVGLISALALGVGFIAGLISVGLSWRINKEQKLELEKVRSDAETRLQIETEKVRADADTNLKVETEKVRGEAGKKIEDAKAEARVKIEQAKADADAKA